MGLDVVEASSGMGMHLKDLPPYILERQMKVGLIIYAHREHMKQMPI